MRRIICLNQEWYFAKTKKVPSCFPEGWELVMLPHTWNAADGQDGGNDYYRGTCTYVKRLQQPQMESGERCYLEIQGAAMTAEVFLNGTRLAHHEGGFSTFRVDLTESLCEDNLLCITVDNGVNDRVYPQKADFTFYGGLYRDVNLIFVPHQHFELEKDGMPGIKITPQVEGHKAHIKLETWQNGGDAVQFTVCEKDGSTLVTADTPVRDGYAVAEIDLENVHLWDGILDPYLYTVRADLLSGQEMTDTVSSRFGCRTFSFDSEKGFFLNGKAYPLRGVSRHQDRAAVGNALTDDMHRQDMELIREIGANTIRLAHYQHAQYFYDLADENGMVVWAEIPYITQHMENGRENTVSQMRELVTQCYNHPSIVCWGLSNEITASGTVTEDLLENHRLLNELCHQMDSTRPTAMAHVFMLETDSPVTQIADINSYNLYFGWYLGSLEQNEQFFDDFHQKYPDRIIGFSEYGADANIRFQTASPDVGDYTEQYQVKYHEHILKQCIEPRPYLWATHVWNMFDFAADGRDEGGAHGLNQKGLVTFDRTRKKDAFYLYKAAWSKEPFVHLCGKRYVDRAEEVTEIRVYSNQQEVTLYVDGQNQEKKEGKGIFTFSLPVNGQHEIVAEADGCSDHMTIRKVQEPNQEYLFQKDAIVNWFDREEIDRAYFSIQDTMGEIMSNSQSAAILDRIMQQAAASRGDVAESTRGNRNLEKMMAGMKLQSLLKQAGDAITPEQIRGLNSALQKIRK